MILKLCLILFLWMWVIPVQADLVPLLPTTAENGIGPWQETPFGQIRVLSCTTGVKDLAMAVGGLEVQLKPGWIMKKPHLEPLSSDFPSWIESPVIPGPVDAPVYQGNVVFPIVLLRNPKETAPFYFGLQGDFPVCHDNKCLTFPIRITLPLSTDSADYTSVCAYLIEQQKLVPLPAQLLGIKGDAWEEAGEIHFVFTGIKGAHIAFLQALNSQAFQMTETRFEENGILMQGTVTPWAQGTTQDWILISDSGLFKIPVTMREKAQALPVAPVSWKIWFLGWELFFLTPLFIWWGLGMKATKKAEQQAVMRFLFLLPVALILKAILNQFMPMDIFGYALIVLGIVCLFPPQKGMAALALFLLWPYFPDLPKLPIQTFAVWLIVMWAEVMVPFFFLYFWAGELHKVLVPFKKNHFFTYNLIFLLPTLILLGHMIWQNIGAQPVYSEKLNPSGFSIVCEKKECLSWPNIPNVTFIDPDSALGRNLQKMYHRSEAVIWQKEEKKMILPPYTDEKDALLFMKNWQNYHAEHTP